MGHLEVEQSRRLLKEVAFEPKLPQRIELVPMNLKAGSLSSLHYEGFQSFMYPCLHSPSKATWLPSNQGTKSISYSLNLDYPWDLPTLANRMQRPFFPGSKCLGIFVENQLSYICLFRTLFRSTGLCVYLSPTRHCLDCSNFTVSLETMKT